MCEDDVLWLCNVHPHCKWSSSWSNGVRLLWQWLALVCAVCVSTCVDVHRLSSLYIGTWVIVIVIVVVVVTAHLKSNRQFKKKRTKSVLCVG